MKKEISKPALLGLLALVVAILGFFIFKSMNAPVGDQMDKKDREIAYDAMLEAEKRLAESGGGGGGGEAAARQGK